MSTLDLFTPDFPHGTRDGFTRGCRGSACPNQNTDLMTCRHADGRAKSDYRYAKLLAAGGEWLSTADVPATETAPVTPAAAPAPTPRPSKKPTVDTSSVELVNEALDGNHFEVFEKPAKSMRGRKIALDDPEFPHGTRNGRPRGCRDESACPGHPETGITCGQAQRDYQRDWRANRAKTTEDAAAEPAPLTEAPTAPPETESTELVADVREQIVNDHQEIVGTRESEWSSATPEPVPSDDASRQLAQILNDVPSAEAHRDDDGTLVGVTPHPQPDIAGLLEDLGRARMELDEANSENTRLTEKLAVDDAALLIARDRIATLEAALAEGDTHVTTLQSALRRHHSTAAAPVDIVVEIGGHRVTIAAPVLANA